MRHAFNTIFATKQVGRVRLIRIGRLCLAIGILREPTPDYLVPSRKVPVWLDGAGVRIHLPEIAL